MQLNWPERKTRCGMARTCSDAFLLFPLFGGAWVSGANLSFLSHSTRKACRGIRRKYWIYIKQQSSSGWGRAPEDAQLTGNKFSPTTVEEIRMRTMTPSHSLPRLLTDMIHRRVLDVGGQPHLPYSLPWAYTQTAGATGRSRTMSSLTCTHTQTIVGWGRKMME